MLGTGKDNLKS